MTKAAPGWYPYDAGAAKHASWSDLADAKCWPPAGERKYWDGTQFVGPAVSNEDVTAIASCPRCHRYTGFVDLTPDEKNRILAKSLVWGPGTA
jgi:hypothetical protein